MSYFIDTHSHLYSEKFVEDREAMLERADEVNVKQILMPNVDRDSIEGMLALEKENPKVYIPMMGLHPCSVQEEHWKEELALVKQYLDERYFCAVGEIGVDLYWDKTTRNIQMEAFKLQIEWAKEKNIPIAIHCREAFDEVFEVLEGFGTTQGVLHCFTGNLAQAERCVALGLHLGIGGVATYKKGGLDAVIPHIPLDKLLLETDAPYLPPVPYRGKRNESSCIPYIANQVADFKAITIEEVMHQTTASAQVLFSLPPL